MGRLAGKKDRREKFGIIKIFLLGPILGRKTEVFFLSLLLRGTSGRGGGKARQAFERAVGVGVY